MLSFCVALCANVLIYTGLAFMDARLLPSWSSMATAYDATGRGTRLVMMAFLAGLPANMMFSWCFKESGAAIGGMCILATTALALLGNTVMMGTEIAPRTVAAALSVLAATAWFGYEAN